jgi:GPN-loop GTPase
MQDFEEFQQALATHSGTRDAEGEPTYMNSLMNSMSLVLDEFYKHLKVRSVPFVNQGSFDPSLIGCRSVEYDRHGR